MGTIKFPSRVILFTGLLYNNSVDKEKIFSVLEDSFGKIALTSEIFPFTETHYYEAEMGKNVLRVFASFEPLIDPSDIPDIKIRTNEIEEKLFCSSGNRDVNIDPGYLTNGKVILVTTKNHQHRIYLRKGIYGEVTLRYRKGSFIPWEWTYPDYRRPESIAFFNQLRERYKIVYHTMR
ncbi:MAG: DUF4416 family protein [Spirochaetota bacterium]|nr:MAG: DUF4416 family protein [Spirochaetota bacterium]